MIVLQIICTRDLSKAPRRANARSVFNVYCLSSYLSVRECRVAVGNDVIVQGGSDEDAVLSVL